MRSEEFARFPKEKTTTLDLNVGDIFCFTSPDDPVFIRQVIAVDEFQFANRVINDVILKTNLFRDRRNRNTVYRLTTKDYDPKQQPWDDDDI